MKCPKCGYQSFNFLTDCKKCGRDLTETQEKFGFTRLGRLESPATKKTNGPVVIKPDVALAEKTTRQPEKDPPKNEMHRDKLSREDSLEVFFKSLDKPESSSSTRADFFPGEDLPQAPPFQSNGTGVGGELFPFDAMDADLDALQQPLEEINEPFLLDIAFEELDELPLKPTVPAVSLNKKHDASDCAKDTSLPAAVEKGVPLDRPDLPIHLPEAPEEEEYFFSFEDLAEDLATLPEVQAPSLDWDRTTAENAFGPTQEKNIGETVSTSGQHRKEKWPLPESPAKESDFFDFSVDSPDNRNEDLPRTGAQSALSKGLVPDLKFESLDSKQPEKTIGNPAWSASADISIDLALPTTPELSGETDSPEGPGMEGEQTRSRVALTLRSWALLVDLSILSTIFFLFVLAGEMVRSPQGAGWFIFTPEALLDLATPYFLVLFVLCFGYFTLFHYLTGQTPGKMLWNIRVEDETGESLSLTQAFLRTVGGLAALLPAGLGLLSIPMNPGRRGWNDRLANSRVVIVESGGKKEVRR